MMFEDETLGVVSVLGNSSSQEVASLSVIEDKLVLTSCLDPDLESVNSGLNVPEI